MTMRRVCAAAAVLFAAGAGTASATAVKTTLFLTESFSYSYTPLNSGHGPSSVKNNLKSSYTVKMNSMALDDAEFFTIDPASSSGLCGGATHIPCTGTNDIVKGTISVDLSLALKETVTTTSSKGKKTSTTTTLGTGSLTAAGIYYADYDTTAGNRMSCTTSPGRDTDCFVWSGETTSATSVQYQVKLSNNDIILATLFNAQDWAIAPHITLDLDSPGQTPLPAALPLVAGGLGMIGLFGRRRRDTARA